MLSKLASLTGVTARRQVRSLSSFESLGVATNMMKDGLKLFRHKKFEVAVILPDKTRALSQHDPRGIFLNQAIKDLLQKSGIVDNSQLSMYYFCGPNGSKVHLLTDRCWGTFFEKLTSGRQYELHIDLVDPRPPVLAASQDPLASQAQLQNRPSSLSEVMKGIKSELSALYHDTWKRLIASSDADETALETVQEKLEGYGYFDFTDDLTKLVEKRGVSKKNWHEMVDAWVEAGLPPSKASEFKLAAETEEGDSCSEMFEKTTSHDGVHVRKLHYLRIQVLQRVDGLLDILFAVHIATAYLDMTAPNFKKATGPVANNYFKKYMRLSSASSWKEEVACKLDSTKN
ncbi:unnamed protein product [Symbiodinium sp. CCMP2592]|nr:unnamed protein product [Symbiodinium sp. CCMP2592]